MKCLKCRLALNIHFRARISIGLHDPKSIQHDQRLTMKGAPSPRPGSVTHIDGVATYPDASSARICIKPQPPSRERNGPRARTSPRTRALCAVGTNADRRAACRDACQCACKAVLQPAGPLLPWHWLAALLRRSACVDLCLPACAQPRRVVRSEFAGPL